jgi:hypothetical protein
MEFTEYRRQSSRRNTIRKGDNIVKDKAQSSFFKKRFQNNDEIGELPIPNLEPFKTDPTNNDEIFAFEDEFNTNLMEKIKRPRYSPQKPN